MELKKSLKDSRKRTGGTVTSQDAYKFYKESSKKSSKEGKPVNAKTHIDILHRFNEIVSEKLLEGKAINLPTNAGLLFVCKKEHKSKKKNIDFGHWRKTGEVREHLNEHTDYMLLDVFYKNGRIANTRRFQFVPCRNLTRAISKKAQEKGSKDFIEIKVISKKHKKG